MELWNHVCLALCIKSIHLYIAVLLVMYLHFIYDLPIVCDYSVYYYVGEGAAFMINVNTKTPLFCFMPRPV